MLLQTAFRAAQSDLSRLRKQIAVNIARMGLLLGSGITSSME